MLQAVLEAVGVRINLLLGLGLMLVDIKSRSVNNCRTFVERSTLRLQAAVEHANLALGGGQRVRFALPAYAADNAMLAPEPWVFALNDDLSTQDPAVYPGRALACRDGRHRPRAPLR